jgi:dTDP-glucose 4,6-dehydratase
MILPEADLTHVLEHVAQWEKLRGKRIFVAGASGFVGTWLRESFQWANERLGLGAELASLPRNSLPAGDFDFGIHAAKADGFAADMDGTRRILDFAAERGVGRFLFTSSGAVYGTLPSEVTHVTEDFVGVPETEYAQAKYAGEQLCSQYPFCAVIARMFTFAGPALPLNLNFAIGNFIRDVLAGGAITIAGDGTSQRSYLYAADLAVWLWTLLLEGEGARPYNVGSSEAVTISELARQVVANTKPKTRIITKGDGGESSYVPSVERAWAELRLRPLISLGESIRRMYAWNLCAKEREMTLVPATTA